MREGPVEPEEEASVGEDASLEEEEEEAVEAPERERIAKPGKVAVGKTWGQCAVVV